jgi:NADH-quinone oxidoreductase subunit E
LEGNVKIESAATVFKHERRSLCVFAPLREIFYHPVVFSVKRYMLSIMHSTSSLLTDEIRTAIQAFFPRYPTKQAVTLPALHVVNEHLGYVPPEAVEEIAELLELAPAQVQDTLSFYGFFKQDKPQGKTRIWVCRSISCAACESEAMLGYLCEKLGIEPGETTADGRITLEFAECLGACDYAPAILVGDTLYKNMTKEKIEELIKTL